jgi:hypothetical protein
MSKPSNPLAYLLVFGGKPGDDKFRIEGIYTDLNNASTALATHPHHHSKITRKKDMPRLVTLDLGLIAWDISDAFAKTEEHCLDFGMDDIVAALPAFITNILANIKD